MVQPVRGQVSQILVDLERGDHAAADRLLPIVYKELRRLAAFYMRGEKPGQTIQATELVHEAFLRLVGHDGAGWHGRTHFFATAASAMRRILIDRARRKLAEKHGGGCQILSLEEVEVSFQQKSEDLLALDDALQLLEQISPRQGRVVELRFFGGLDMEDIARIEGVSLRTIKQDWTLARAWLHHQIQRVK